MLVFSVNYTYNASQPDFFSLYCKPQIFLLSSLDLQPDCTSAITLSTTSVHKLQYRPASLHWLQLRDISLNTNVNTKKNSITSKITITLKVIYYTHYPPGIYEKQSISKNHLQFLAEVPVKLCMKCFHLHPEKLATIS